MISTIAFHAGFRWQKYFGEIGVFRYKKKVIFEEITLKNYLVDNQLFIFEIPFYSIKFFGFGCYFKFIIIPEFVLEKQVINKGCFFY